MKGNLAVALPEKLSKKVRKLQEQMDLKSPGEVILKALSLLELSMGRKVELKDDDDTFEIKSFEGLKQSIKLDDIEEKEN
jgi:hypothetical protein